MVVAELGMGFDHRMACGYIGGGGSRVVPLLHRRRSRNVRSRRNEGFPRLLVVFSGAFAVKLYVEETRALRLDRVGMPECSCCIVVIASNAFGRGNRQY